MSWVNVNTFHWHITDTESDPLEVAQYPELAINGAYSQEVYTKNDVQYIVQYAATRYRHNDGQCLSVNFSKKHSIFYQEIDTPGHTGIIAATYPEYIACLDGEFRFALPEVVNFTASLLSDVAKTLPLNYFSTSGDEVNATCYNNDYPTQQQLNSTGMTLNGALDAFTWTSHGALIAEGKTPVVWEGVPCFSF